MAHDKCGGLANPEDVNSQLDEEGFGPRIRVLARRSAWDNDTAHYEMNRAVVDNTAE